jgi:hypothetical protein
MCLFVAVESHAETAKGRVFEDLNSNGKLDAGEPGIAGCRVSDGMTIVVTDERGDYQLEIGEEAVIFITKPKGYATPVDQHQLPRFYYIHQPNGSPPAMRYPGITPTGPLPDEINFPLIAQEEPRRFEVILFSDTQPQTEAEIDYIRDDFVAELIGTEAKFGMTLGDILFDDKSFYPRLNAILAQIGIPWYNVPGNHDVNFEANDDRYALETFKHYFGPPYYSFEYGDVLFVVLDNIEYQGRGEPDPGDVRGSGGYIAKLGERQLVWLERELSHVPDDKLVFLTMHSSLETYIADSPGVTTVDRAELFEILSGRPNIYAVAGHTHTTEHHYFDEDDGFSGPGQLHHHLLSTVSGAWWSGPFDTRGIPTSDQRDGTPNGYHILEVNGTDLTIRFKAAGLPDSYQMRIIFDVAHHGLGIDGMRDFRHGELYDGHLTEDQVPAAEVLVNLFDGGPKSVVELKIDDGPFLPMRRVERVDPYMLELYARNPDTKKSWVQATPSSHIFSADLPDELKAGVYTLSVRAKDEFGRVHYAHAILEITGR